MPWCTFNFVFIVISRRTAIHVGLLFLLLGDLYLKALSMDTHLFLTVQGGEGKNTTGFGSGTEGVGRVGGRVSSTVRQWGTWEPHTHTHCGCALWPHRLPLCSSNREGQRATMSSCCCRSLGKHTSPFLILQRFGDWWLSLCVNSSSRTYPSRSGFLTGHWITLGGSSFGLGCFIFGSYWNR